MLMAIAVLGALIAAFGLSSCGGSGGLPVMGSSTSGPDFQATFTPATVNKDDAQGTYDAGIDTTHCNDGYIGAFGVNSSRLKLQVSHDGAAYNYDLPNNGQPATFPINMGNGHYTFTLFQNVKDTRYVQLFAVEEDVALGNDRSPFLVPNVFCNYSQDSACVRKAQELTANAKNQGDALAAIYDFICDNIVYDVEKARALASTTGYVPNPDDTLADGKGICFDYSSLAAAMLRSIGIPTQIVTGTIEEANLYHAWNMVYLDGTWQSVGISVKSRTWTRIDTTFAAGGMPSDTPESPTYSERYVY